MLFLAIIAITRGDLLKDKQINRFINPLFREKGTRKHFISFITIIIIIKIFIAKSFNKIINSISLPRVIKLNNYKYLIPRL